MDGDRVVGKWGVVRTRRAQSLWMRNKALTTSARTAIVAIFIYVTINLIMVSPDNVWFERRKDGYTGHTQLL